MKKILLIIVPLLAFIAGAVGGDMLHAGKPATATETAPGAEAAEQAETADVGAHGQEAEADTEDGHGAKPQGGHGAEVAKDDSALDWFKFPTQFFVPILRNGTPTAIMVLSLTVEMPVSARPEIEAQEHRLRDALLNALMIEANTGGFDGNFTSDPAQQRLRAALLDAAQKAAGPSVKRILIEDIGRQQQ